MKDNDLPYHCDVCTMPGYGDAECSPLCDRKHERDKQMSKDTSRTTLEDFANRLFNRDAFMLSEEYKGKPAVTITFPDAKQRNEFHTALVQLSTYRTPDPAKSDFPEFVDRNPEWKKLAAEMDDSELSRAKYFEEKGLLGRYGSDERVTYHVPLKAAVEYGFPPQYWIDMSPTQKKTHAQPHYRTKDDYLQILTERPDAHFGEMDNIAVLLDMHTEGLIAFDERSKIGTMFTSLHPTLTEAGKAAAIKGQK